MDVSVRKVALADVEALWAALDGVARERRYLSRLEAPPLERVAAFVARNVENDRAQYVAVHGGRLVGWADIVPLEPPTMRHVGTLGMGVVRGYRQQGIGSSLLARTIEHAWGSGLKRLELQVFADNAPAIALYERHGYEIEGRQRYACLVDGAYQDLLMMAQVRV